MEKELLTGTRLINPVTTGQSGSEPLVFGCSHPNVIDGSMFCDGNCSMCGYRTEIKEITIQVKDYPGIEDFFTSGEVVVIPDDVEKEINDYISEYASEVEKREFEAVEESKRIFLH